MPGVLKASSFTFKTFTIAFGGLDGGTGLLKGLLGLANCSSAVDFTGTCLQYL